MSGWTGKDLVAAVALALTILGAAVGYGAVTERVAAVERRADLSDEVAAMKAQLVHLDRQLDRIEGKMDRRNRSERDP
jgi:hypothetical protein